MALIKVLTLNTELRNHLNRWLPFIEKERPDIICLQETYVDIIDSLAQKLGYSYVFDPRVRIVGESTFSGSAILSRFPIKRHQFLIYEEQAEILPRLKGIHATPVTSGVTIAKIEIEGREITVGTTHFTWSAGGLVTDEQRQMFTLMLEVVKPFNELILGGDFNTPRGSELYDELARRFQDNVPAQVRSTVDPELHRTKGLELVVDGIFTTPNFKTKDGKVYEGLSDHKAVEVTIWS